MSEVYHPEKINPELAREAHVSSLEQYYEMYNRSVSKPEEFWAEMAEEHLTWFKKWDKVLESDFAQGKNAWFTGGKLNLTWNALDRHLDTPRKNKAALIWEGDFPEESRIFTYQQLHREVSRFANVLKKYGVKKGDRVTIYLPMIPELAVSVLACARIGAIHSVVFGGFSPDALKDRILDAKSDIVITSDGAYRGGKTIPMKQNADTAIAELDHVRHMFVVRRTGHDLIHWKDGRDIWYHRSMLADDILDHCEAEHMDSEDPLFILYTSGSTGKPKGVLHTTGGYGLYTSMTHKYVFDVKETDTYWCTADVGWVTGHSYILYGPLINGATSIMFEGVPTWPENDRFWQIVQKYKVNTFYTAPTAIRALMRFGDDPVKKHDLSSLRILGTVGEPINPEAWRWYFNVVGGEKCPIVDTWWQTETGGHLITPLPGATPAKPGSATLPFFGVEPVLVDGDGRELEGETEGNLCIKSPWPSIMRTVYGDDERFYNTYFSTFKGYYFSGDGARRDADGYYWITGRVDDVLNVSGHRLGTAEIESALVLHSDVAEAAVVGYPHDIKGQGIYAYVILNEGVIGGEALKQDLVRLVSNEISPIAKPDIIQFAPGLPKTRSGKIMRRILRKIAAGETDSLGDTSTLADPGVVDVLIKDSEHR